MSEDGKYSGQRGGRRSTTWAKGQPPPVRRPPGEATVRRSLKRELKGKQVDMKVELCALHAKCIERLTEMLDDENTDLVCYAITQIFSYSMPRAAAAAATDEVEKLRIFAAALRHDVDAGTLTQ